MLTVPKILTNYQSRINSYLEQQLQPSATLPGNPTLNAAMQYVVIGKAKRLRAALVYACGELLNCPIENLDAPAASVELIHAYSLVHDDLPSLDNDDWRRGKLACHKVYNEATAILVGDALQSLAFTILATQNKLPAQQILDMIKSLASASGMHGMVAGQMHDIEACKLTTEEILLMHRQKTGMLIESCVEMTLIASDDTPDKQKLMEFAYNFGIAFQLHNDLIDTQIHGRENGSDHKNNKTTIISQSGSPTNYRKFLDLYNKANTLIMQLHNQEKAVNLKKIFDYVLQFKDPLPITLTDQ